MKRFFILILAISMLISVSACSESTENTSDKPEQSEEYKKAVALIEEGKYKESYLLLRSLTDDSDAQELIKDFSVVYSKEVITYPTDDKTNSTEYKYDDKGNLETKTATNKYGLKTITNYIYQNGKLVSSVCDGKDTVKYVYDDKGLLIKEVGTDPMGKESVNEYFYDGNRNIIKNVYTDSTATITREYTYNSDNKLTKETSIASYGTSLETEYIYDGKALVKKIETAKFDKSEAYDKVVHEYTNNAYGDPTECVSTTFRNGTESAYYTEYSYDADGNLIKTAESDDSYGTYKTTEYSGYLYFYCPEK